MLTNAYGVGEKSFDSYSASCCNNVFLGKVPMWCHTLLLPARMSSMFPHRNFTTKFVANLYRLYESTLAGIS